MTTAETAKTAKVLARRQLRDGRQIAEVNCPWCRAKHWLLVNMIGIAECLVIPGKLVQI